MTRIRRAPALLGATAVLALSACGGDDGADAGTATTEATATGTGPSTATEVGTAATTDVGTGTAATGTGAPPATTGTGDAAATEPVTITAVDYDFQDVPASVPAGTSFTLDNQGSEPHELVVMRIAEGEERSIEELLRLPDEEAQQVATFQGVAVDLAAPGSEPLFPEGPVTVTEPGRYAVLCFFPVGITDAVLREAMEAETESTGTGGGPPPLPDGEPHMARGMAAEFTVE